MLVLVITDTGLKRIINTDSISFVESAGGANCRIFLKEFPDFPIRVEMEIESLLLVLKGEKEFADVFAPPKHQVYQDDSLAIKELNKEVQAPPATGTEEIPSFSKKKVAAKKVESGW
jgi:hypothetical protein